MLMLLNSVASVTSVTSVTGVSVTVCFQFVAWPGLTPPSEMLAQTGSMFLVLVALLLPPQVVTFTFPGDWHKIRQMMEARKEAEVLSQTETFHYLEIFFFNRTTVVLAQGETFYLLMTPWKTRLTGTLSNFQQQLLPLLPNQGPDL